MVDFFNRNRRTAAGVHDRRTKSGGQAAVVGLIGMLGAGTFGLGVAGVEQALCFAGLRPCLTPIVSPDRKLALSEIAEGAFASAVGYWAETFEAEGAVWRAPTLVLLDTAQQTACGEARAGGGPVYCSYDETIYMDLAFFDRIAASEIRLGGDFAASFVIAHEVAHHVQNMEGAFVSLEAARRGESVETFNQVSQRFELQADCLAGVWAARVATEQEGGALEAGDLAEALTLARYAGDDSAQRRRRGFIDESTFRHGRGAQRAAWFQRGFDEGVREACDTFSPALAEL